MARRATPGDSGKKLRRRGGTVLSMATSKPCLSTVSPATAVDDFSTWRLRAARFQGTWSAGICSAQAVERRMAVIRMSPGRFWQLRRAVSLLRDLRRAQLLGRVSNRCERLRLLAIAVLQGFRAEESTADKTGGDKDKRARPKRVLEKNEKEEGLRTARDGSERPLERRATKPGSASRVAARARRRRIGERRVS